MVCLIIIIIITTCVHNPEHNTHLILTNLKQICLTDEWDANTYSQSWSECTGE